MTGIFSASPRGTRQGGLEMAPPNSLEKGQPPPTQGRRGSLRLQSRNLHGQTGVTNPVDVKIMNSGGNVTSMDLSRSGPPVSNARSSGLI